MLFGPYGWYLLWSRRKAFMAHYGVWIGIGLVALATAIALLLGAKAARSVEQFRSEDHEMFTRKTRP
jgi:hypothetical protein